MVKTKTISGTKVLIATCIAIGFLAIANAFLPPSLTNIKTTYWDRPGDCIGF